MTGFAGETAMDCSVMVFIVSVSAGLTTLPIAAVICVAPEATPVAKPVESIVAALALEDTQVAVAVMSFELPSL